MTSDHLDPRFDPRFQRGYEEPPARGGLLIVVVGLFAAALSWRPRAPVR